MLSLPSDDRELLPGEVGPALVASSTAAKVRTFLYEIAEGTTNYRSLHSLTQQVEHQYHGRFLVELIQNAHDALFPEHSTDRGRIEIQLDLSDGPFGALYVANDGAPFTESNFVSLSQLGQSDKDPQVSIGNKGIGFRSVLEISESPEIFSRRIRNSEAFDGFCFRFTPESLTLLAAPIEALTQDATVPQSPFSHEPLVDWDQKLLTKFRRVVARRQPGWLSNELSYLSPYLLPIPLSRLSAPATVARFEKAGFSTVLRLPLRNPESLILVRTKMRELRPSTVLFLERVSALVLDDGEKARRVTRATLSADSTLGGQDIQITSDEGAPNENYRVWSRIVRVEDSGELRESIRHLPGKWPQLQEARVSIASRIGAEPDVGAFSVFLPTLVRTGSAIHVNAPFFADMSRTFIDFEQAYNRILLETAWQLSTDVVRSDLAGKHETEAQIIVDLLAPLSNQDEAGKRWQLGVGNAFGRNSASDLDDEPLFLSESGWCALNQASLFPPIVDAIVFTEEALRKHATFGVFHTCLSTRREQLEYLSRAAGFGVHPRAEDLAETAEVIAQAIHNVGEVNWNAFWSELAALTKNDRTHLATRKILLGQDGTLHAAGGDCVIFFAPRRGVDDDDGLASDSTIMEIPPTLQPYVAFLHDSIKLYDENNRQTPTRKFLDELVETFRVEDIFARVLIPRTPPLPVRLGNSEAAICADILHWGFRLLSNLVARGVGNQTTHQLGQLALPCMGGWYRADETSFGPGWANSQGDTLERYLTSARTSDCDEAYKRLLLPPVRSEWSRDAVSHADLLSAAGVFDGLRLSRIDPGHWNNVFFGASGVFTLPESAPPGIPSALWKPYRTRVHSDGGPTLRGMNEYRMQALLIFPGLGSHAEFDAHTKLALMELILTSLCRWPSDWMNVVCRKPSGSFSAFSVRSPLWFALSHLKWLGFGSAGRTEWSAPHERWHVPAKVLGTRSWQFDYLHPIPLGTAHRLDADPTLAATLVSLGMPQYNLETTSGSVLLLNALAEAADSDEVRDPNVFLGQVRSAWANFTPDGGHSFPQKLLVEREARLVAIEPSIEQPVYIPDSPSSFISTLRRFGIPILAIEPQDARRLASALRAQYGDALVLTSTVQMLPVVDGDVWVGGESHALRDSEFAWMIELALTLAAYAGFQSRGTGTQRFADQIQVFREVRITGCQTLSTRLDAHVRVYEQSDIPAIWLPEHKTLLIAEGCRENPSLLSEVLAAILERDDLIVPLKLVFREAGISPRQEDLVRALGFLHLMEWQYLDIRGHWHGALRHVTDRLLCLLTNLIPNADHSDLVSARSEDEVTGYLASLKHAQVEPAELLALTRSAENAFEFGLACFRKYGPTLQLDRWNAAVRLLRERPIQNTHAAAEFATHANEALPVLRSILAAALRNQPAPQSARALLAELDGIACPPSYSSSRWEVGWEDSMAPFAELFARISAPTELLAHISASQSREDLSNRIAGLGIDPAFDPAETARKNRERLRGRLAEWQEIGLAWALATGTIATSWESRIDRDLEALDEHLATAGYLTLWSDGDLVALLRSLPRDSESETLWEALDRSQNLDALLSALGLRREQLTTARRDLAELKEQARRRNRLVSVCGQEFDSSSDNLEGLWQHILRGVPDSTVTTFDPINLAEPAGLSTPPKRKPSGQRTLGSYSAPASPKVNENLIGLAGEIHAFRKLQQQHGNAVSASSWLSRNSLFVYPDNRCDDGIGCDFRFVVDRCTYHVEVKSSGGADEMFTLGSSEIRLAMELSKPHRSRHRNVFVFLRVLHALSERPQFLVLPNPYDLRFRSLYDIVEAEARVRYRVSDALLTL